MPELIIPYEPREPQWELHRALDAGSRKIVLVWHRRAGKTLACVQQLIRSALLIEREAPRLAYIAPLYKQAKSTAWDYLRRFARMIPGTEARESELRVDFPNGGRVQLFGADNPDAMRGIYLDGVILDEFGQIHPRLRREVIIPALVDRGGYEVVCGTPMGRNQFYDLYERAVLPGSGWVVLLRRASDTGLLSKKDLAEARGEMSYEEYQQEFECSWLSGAAGAYYARYLIEAEQANRIREVPYDPALGVTTAWDLGIGDSTAIWFLQRQGAELRAIDYYEADGEPLAHYAKVLKDKDYYYADHLVPHDAGARSLHTGKTLVELARTLGLRMRVVPISDLAEGIEAVRRILPRMFFDRAKTLPGRDALAGYKRRYNARLDEFMGVPEHDWSSHGADALRTFAVDLAFRAERPKRTAEYALV
jgi:hypothetical protein